MCREPRIGGDEVLAGFEILRRNGVIALIIERSLFVGTLNRLMLHIDGCQIHDAAAGVKRGELRFALEQIGRYTDEMALLRSCFHRTVRVLAQGALGRNEDRAKLLDVPVRRFPCESTE